MQSTITNKKRVNTHISLEAHEILYKHTTPKTMGAFLSNLLIEYGHGRTIRDRIRRLEEELAEVKHELFIQEITINQLDTKP